MWTQWKKSILPLQVLIETYWNVNDDGVVFCYLAPGLNRNILECKFNLHLQRRERQRVLIETYWNVNIIDLTKAISVLTVLIETYWNVNV